MRLHYYLVFSLLIFVTSCKNRNERLNSTETKNQSTPEKKAPQVSKEKKIGKAVFYLENSGSMFGYVNGFTEYVDVVSELAEKPRFAEEKTKREFYFVNGGQKIKITNIGENPANLIDKLNLTGFNCGDVSKSNLNSMFQLALSRAKNDTISILISDAIYDIGKPQAPMNALSTEGRETRSRFIERLNDGDLQTIIIKLNSHFDGKYFPVTGGSKKLSQDRPFYVWIFGETELLNEYFGDEYIKSLKGFSDIARFLKWNKFSIPYQITTKEKKGSFKFGTSNKNKLTKAKPIHDNFQFSFAVDFSALPFSDEFCLNQSNYNCKEKNYSIEKIISYNQKIPGVKFKPSHLVTLKSTGNPYGKLNVSFNYNNPVWIKETNIDSENNIVGDTTHTFGFNFLTNAITEAYNYINKSETMTNFNFEVTKN